MQGSLQDDYHKWTPGNFTGRAQRNGGGEVSRWSIGMEITITESELATIEDLYPRIDEIEALSERRQAEAIEALLMTMERSGPPADGKRRRPRIRCMIAVEYRAEGGTYRETASDISEDGMFILSGLNERLKPGQEVRITGGKFPGGGPAEFCARVARKSGAGFAVQFVKLDLQKGRIIDGVMERLRKRLPENTAK